MKAAPGTGIVSSIVLESDDLDEIDWVSDYRPILSSSEFLISNLNIYLGSRRWRHDPNRDELLRKRRYHDVRPRNLGACLDTARNIPYLQSRLDERNHHLVR
mgnify:FL=1